MVGSVLREVKKVMEREVEAAGAGHLFLEFASKIGSKVALTGSRVQQERGTGYHDRGYKEREAEKPRDHKCENASKTMKCYTNMQKRT